MRAPSTAESYNYLRRLFDLPSETPGVPTGKMPVLQIGAQRPLPHYYFTNWAKISFASSSVSLLPMSYHVPLI